MNEIIQEWVTDLESGEFAQTTGGVLREGDRFCCWGVLAEQAVRKGFLVRELQTNSEVCAYRLATGGNLCAGYPPNELLEWAGIDPKAFRGEDTVYYLANVNDSGSNFQYIANLIKETL